MEESLEKGRIGGFEIQASSRSKAQDESTAKEVIGETSPGRLRKGGLSNRTLDMWSSERVDTRPVWDKLPSRSCMESTSLARLELPEAGKTRQGKRRKSDYFLAEEGMAAYKKKPVNSATASYLSMKAGLCCILPAYGRGHLEGKHQFNTLGTGTTDFLSFLRSLLHREEEGLICISESKRATSNSIRCLNSLPRFDYTSVMASYSCLTGITYTKRLCAYL